MAERNRIVMISEFQKLSKAYMQGKRARIAGKAMKSNPFAIPNGGRGQTEYGHWVRGWVAASLRK